MPDQHVVGVVALIWSANPKLGGEIDKTQQILRETAQPHEFTCVTDAFVCGCPLAMPNDFVNH